VLWRGSKQERHPRIRSARRGVHFSARRTFLFIIGIHPHKGSHTAAVIDGDEQVVGEPPVLTATFVTSSTRSTSPRSPDQPDTPGAAPSTSPNACPTNAASGLN
jgi:hypothetical protein